LLFLFFFQNKTEDVSFDVGCGNECKIEQVRDISLFPVYTSSKNCGEGKEKTLSLTECWKIWFYYV